MSASWSALAPPDLLCEDLLEMFSRDPEVGLLEAIILPELGGAMAGLGGSVLLEREPDTEIFSAVTEFLELGRDVLTGRLERGGGGGIVTSLRTCSGK